MIKSKVSINILLIVVFTCVFTVFSWSVSGSALSERGQVSVENRGFEEAQRLKGGWVRQDGGYTLVIEDIKPGGILKVSYLNPRKINVSVAKWSYEDNRLHVFIELRDVNYPGSIYKLLYEKKQNVLIGTYFQAVHKQTYNVSFKKRLDQR